MGRLMKTCPIEREIPFDMMREHEKRKAEFAAYRIGPTLFSATGGVVRTANYVVDASGNLEFVRLELDRGSDAVRYVNVTADSEWAMLKDVMNAVAEVMD